MNLPAHFPDRVVLVTVPPIGEFTLHGIPDEGLLSHYGTAPLLGHAVAAEPWVLRVVSMGAMPGTSVPLSPLAMGEGNVTPVAGATQGGAVELCAGLGGIGVGLRALGFNVAKAYDSWAEAVAVYNHNFPSEVAVVTNLLSEKGRQLVAADGRRLGGVEILAAGPPCKGFSQLRNGHHDGRNGHNRVLAAMPDYVALLPPPVHY